MRGNVAQLQTRVHHQAAEIIRCDSFFVVRGKQNAKQTSATTTNAFFVLPHQLICFDFLSLNQLISFHFYFARALAHSDSYFALCFCLFCFAAVPQRVLTLIFMKMYCNRLRKTLTRDTARSILDREQLDLWHFALRHLLPS